MRFETRYLQVTTATDSREQAEKIARGVVESRLAAAAQILGPAQSIFWWHGEVEVIDEWLCVMKAPSDQYTALEAFVLAHHSYETAEITALPIVEGSPEYLRWLSHETLHPASTPTM